MPSRTKAWGRIMSVKVRVQKNLQHIAGVPEVVEVSGHTVGECLNQFLEKYPEIEKKVSGRSKRLLDFVEVFINGKSAYPDEESKPVKDGDEIHIMLMFAGG
jgi:molybdopterin converting factor small subunit